MGEWIEGCMLHMASSIKVDTCRRYSPGRNKLPDSGLGPILVFARRGLLWPPLHCDDDACGTLSTEVRGLKQSTAVNSLIMCMLQRIT